MKFLPSVVLILFTLSISNFSQEATVLTDDVQFWNETSVSVPLYKAQDDKGKKTDRITLFFNGVLRLGRNISYPVDKRIGVGLDFRINQYVSLTPSYLYIVAQPFHGRRTEFENRLRFAVNLEKKFKRFSVRDRNLFEYRFRNSRSDSSRYRNKLQVNYPILKNGKELFTPFAADEVYYDFQTKSWTRNEFSAGITKKLSDNLSADFFYLLRNNKGSFPKQINVFGVNLKIKID